MNQPKLPLILSLEERRSNLWLKLMEHWSDQLGAARLQNETDLTDSQTANLRGRIAAIKSCMALDKDKPNFD